MVQNPHRQPEIHPGAEGGGSGEYGRASRHWASHGTRGRRPDNLQTNFARNFPRSLFETTRKRCNSNDVDSTFELNAWELRATLMGGGRDWPSFETTRRREASNGAKPPSLPLVSCSLTDPMLPNGLNTPDQVQSSRWCPSCRRRGGASALAR